MEETPKQEYRSIRCPQCGYMLVEIEAASVGYLRIKCRKCSWRQKKEVLVQVFFSIEIRIPDVLDSR